MSALKLMTFDWVPEAPRGYVRDLRARWAMEEAGLGYRIGTVPFQERGAEHRAFQPFGQVPWLIDGDVSIFESGAILLHLGARSETLMPHDAKARAGVLSWVIAALNSIETAVLPVLVHGIFGGDEPSPGREKLESIQRMRLNDMERVLSGREWLVERFSIADIAMADAFRVTDRFAGGLADYPACRDYVRRATARPAFAKAHADQLAHFAAADSARAG
ncbi:MAG: glutathione S-transferase family protein [Salinarimonas sp.]